jgi:L-threonylcarbamoyladenylate synthase
VSELTAEDAAAFERCIREGGVAVFPADTVYGLAVDPESEAAIARLYELKQRPAGMPSAVMFFSLGEALAAIPELGPPTRAALGLLLPGPVTLLVPNPAGRFPLACGPDSSRLGIRVPALEGALAALADIRTPLLQSSANVHGGPDPRRLADVPPEILSGADLALDGGELPGVASTVVDLTDYETDGAYAVLREGALSHEAVGERLKD